MASRGIDVTIPDITGWLPDLLDRFDDEVYVHTIDGVPIYANEACRDSLGVTLEEFRELPPYGWVSEEARPGLPARIEQLSMYGHARFESSYILPNGASGTYEVRAKLLSIGGEPVVLSVGRDVTGRRHMLEDLQLRGVLLDLVDDGVVVSEPDGTILYVNRVAASMHGYRRHRMARMNVLDLALDSSAEKHALSREADTAFTAEHFTATGTVLHLRVVARLVQHRGREVVVRILRPTEDERPA